MKKFTFLLTLLAMVLCNVQSAFADDAKWTDKYIQNVDAAVTSFSNLKDGFYLMRNVGHSTFLREENNGNLYLANVNNYSSEIANIQTNFTGQANLDKLNYVVHLTKDADGTFKIQFKSGKYMPNFGGNNTSSNQTASKLTFAIYSEGESYFNFKDGNGLYANGKGGDASHGAGPGPGNFVGWGNKPSDKTGNGSYQFYPVTLETVYTVNYKYTVNNHVVLAAQKKVAANTAPSADNYPCLTIEGYNKETITESGDVIVNCSMNLPFELSTADAPKYYAIKMHTGNRMMVADEANSQVACYDVSTSLPELPELNQWAFIGTDAFTNFKLYNKATKKYLKSSSSSTIATLVDEADASTFHVMATKIQDMTNGFCISNSSYYLNYQTPQGSNKPGVYGWTDNDQGSTCTVFTPESFPLNYARTYANAPEGAISGKVYLETADNLTALKDAYNAVSSDPTESNINALVTINKAIEASAASTSFKEGYYRLVNRKDNKFLHINGSNIMNTQAGKDKAVGSVVYFKSAGEGKYSLMIEGLYFGAVTTSQNIVLGNETNKGTYTIEFFANKPVAKIHETTTEDSYHYLHVNGGNAVGWEAGEGSPASHWYVIPATDIEVAMKAVEGKSYATAYLPFGVSTISGAEAYVGTLNAEKNALNMTQATSVPAEKGFVLVGTADATKATLTIGNVSETVNSDLVGTNTAITLADATRANYLVFGKNEGNVGFYTPSASVANIPANKAYLETSALSTAAIALNFNGITTGVNTVVLGENGVNAPVFDLSGRRVVAPVKGGVYIQNGKKFIK